MYTMESRRHITTTTTTTRMVRIRLRMMCVYMCVRCMYTYKDRRRYPIGASIVDRSSRVRSSSRFGASWLVDGAYFVRANLPLRRVTMLVCRRERAVSRLLSATGWTSFVRAMNWRLGRFSRAVSFFASSFFSRFFPPLPPPPPVLVVLSFSTHESGQRRSPGIPGPVG